MFESARLAELSDSAAFAYLHKLSREGIEGHRGADLWLEKNSLKGDSEVIFGDLLGDSQYACIIGLYGNYPLGFLIAEQTNLFGDVCVDIHEVFVEADARSVGIGESMMDFLIAWAGSKSASSITSRALPGDRQLKNFFERYKLTARLIEVAKKI